MNKPIYPMYYYKDLKTANSNIKSIIIMDKQHAAKFQGYSTGASFGMIHISDIGDKHITINKFAKHELWISFDDLDYCDKMMGNPITNQDAKDIINFVNNIKNNIDVLIIHCDGGVSRSPTIGVVLAKYLGLSSFNIWANENFCPCHLVFDIMCKACSFDSNTILKFWEYGIRINNRYWEQAHNE